jgi:DNA polymerase delta subunit 2
MIKRKAKEEMLQYATLYFLRLEKLRPMVKDTASMKWLNSEIGISKNLKIVDNILDIKPFEETIIIGTLFKEQKLKPSILKDIMGVLG